MRNQLTEIDRYYLSEDDKQVDSGDTLQSEIQQRSAAELPRKI